MYTLPDRETDIQTDRQTDRQTMLVLIMGHFQIRPVVFKKKVLKSFPITYVGKTDDGLPWRPCNSFTMGCPPVRGDNPRALASGLSYVQVDKHGITILYHLHQCRPCTSSDISC